MSIKQNIISEIKQLATDNMFSNDGFILVRGIEVIDIINKHLEGMAIVPEEPTEAMCAAGFDEKMNWGGEIHIYKAMLTAAKEQT